MILLNVLKINRISNNIEAAAEVMVFFDEHVFIVKNVCHYNRKNEVDACDFLDELASKC